MLKHMTPGAVPQTGLPPRTSLGNNLNNSFAANSSNSTVNDVIIGASSLAPAPSLHQQHVISPANQASVAAAAAQHHLLPLNVSTHTIRSSPHSILGALATTTTATTTTTAAAPAGTCPIKQQQQQQLLQLANGSGPPRCGSLVQNQLQAQHPQPSQHTPLTSMSSSLVMSSHPSQQPSQHHHSCITTPSMTKHRVGAREALTSLGLLCLVSLLLALLSLIFLLKISPGGREPPPPPGPISSEDYIVVYDVTLALCALSLSLNLCCLLVCAIQFLFAVKLVRAPAISGRSNKYLQKSSVSRVCAVGGFFISIPIFLTGIILYTFTQFHSTPAIITSILIGFGIVFCGFAMVHNVFVWQKEKTICVRHQNQSNMMLHAPAVPSTANNSAANACISMISGQPAALPAAAATLYLNHNGNAGFLSGGSNGLHAPLQPQMGNAVLNRSPLPVTPLSPNNSHVSIAGMHSHSAYIPTYGIRPSTATPPTPKVMMGNGGGSSAIGRDACGSVSPGTMIATTANASAGNGTLELSNTGAGISPHELSTLV